MGRQQEDQGRDWTTLLPRVVAGLALAVVVLLNLYLAAAPTFTNDFWFHLKMGEVYAGEGPWPAGDPMLHTAYPHAPIQHEWLFGLALHVCERIVGFQGIRILHFLAVAGILAMAFAIFRRTSGSITLACASTTAFAILSWTRLFQIRPDLISIFATLLLYDLLLRRGRRPGRREIVLASLLSLVWANCHSLFALGPALLVAALLGCGMSVALDAWALSPESRASARARSLGDARPVAIALVAGLALTLINPRGIHQHLTFFSSSRETAIWAVKDEWSHFDPFIIANNPGTVGPLLFWLMNGLIVTFLIVGVAGMIASLRRETDEHEVFDPVLFGLGLASLVALFVSVRFFWMGFFPLLFIADAFGRALRSQTPRFRFASRVSVAVGALLVAVAFEAISGYREVAQRLPRSLDAYFRTAYLSRKFHVEGVRFLRETGVEGKLFNSYPMGGFLGYWLAPELRTFVDSRTEHYPPDVLEDYMRINKLQDLRQNTSYLDILDEREVDLFFGIGMPTDRYARTQGIYTSEHLAQVPGWILVSRSLHHAIYLRKLPRNRENLERIARYYAEAGVPFDRDKGVPVPEIIFEHPEWALEHEMLTSVLMQRIGGDEESPKPRDAAALESLGLIFALMGEYESGLEVEAELERIRPDSISSLRRQVYARIRLDEPERALKAAKRLERLSPGDLTARQFVEIATAYEKLSRTTSGRMRWLDRRVLLDRFIQPIAMISAFDAALIQLGFEGQPRLDTNTSDP